jgi:hypothetical protein
MAFYTFYDHNNFVVSKEIIDDLIAIRFPERRPYSPYTTAFYDLASGLINSNSLHDFARKVDLILERDSNDTYFLRLKAVCDYLISHGFSATVRI